MRRLPVMARRPHDRYSGEAKERSWLTDEAQNIVFEPESGIERDPGELSDKFLAQVKSNHTLRASEITLKRYHDIKRRLSSPVHFTNDGHPTDE
ncbi:hypothetical protein EVAR_5534_1 [Eumeta japonica]|uniref:Uncharacterized protein n=1 Tax=Eumeta variegata TaxID=151549 RepID=A0A4C1T968_EUMVA|nr:hypothetical protein EVAR_5534_1 [Eumeta japonica]